MVPVCYDWLTLKWIHWVWSEDTTWQRGRKHFITYRFNYIKFIQLPQWISFQEHQTTTTLRNKFKSKNIYSSDIKITKDVKPTNHTVICSPSQYHRRECNYNPGQKRPWDSDAIFLGAIKKHSLTFSLIPCNSPSPYLKQCWNSKVTLDTRIQRRLWVGEGDGHVWFKKAPRMQICPKAFVHDCISARDATEFLPLLWIFLFVFVLLFSHFQFSFLMKERMYPSSYNSYLSLFDWCPCYHHFVVRAKQRRSPKKTKTLSLTRKKSSQI